MVLDFVLFHDFFEGNISSNLKGMSTSIDAIFSAVEDSFVHGASLRKLCTKLAGNFSKRKDPWYW